MRLRFTFHPDDHERYGDGTWTLDPEALLRQPVRELIAVEAATGLGIPGMLLVLDRPTDPRYTTALLAATWVARRLGGVTEAYESYEPLVYLMNLERLEDDEVPPGRASSSSPQSEGA